jgi:phage terminase Nu1 subunit (DNA packaging protein)
MNKTSTKPAKLAAEIRNKAGVALHFGVSVKIVERWISEGMPVLSVPPDRNGEYKIDLIAAWQWHLGQLAARAGDLDLDAERARLAKEQADGQELKNAKLRDSLLPADEVVEAWHQAKDTARRICMRIPDEVIPQILDACGNSHTPEKAERAIQKLLTTAIDSALNELANTSFDDDEDEELTVEGVV